MLGLLAVALLVTGGLATSAQASSGDGPTTGRITHYLVTGDAIGCLSPTRCLLIVEKQGHNGQVFRSHGELSVVTDGTPSTPAPIHGMALFNGGISCPTSNRCFALTFAKAGEELLALDGSGKVVGKTVLRAANEGLSTLSCGSVHTCELGGIKTGNPSDTPAIVEQWHDGKAGPIHVLAKRGVTNSDISSISCAGATCVALGNGKEGPIFLTTDHGHPQAYKRVGSGLSQGVGCVSAGHCFGLLQPPGAGNHTEIITFTNGAVASTQRVSLGLRAIACDRSGCTAAGTGRDGAGVVVAISGGALGAAQTDHSVDGGFATVGRFGTGVLAAAGALPSGVDTWYDATAAS